MSKTSKRIYDDIKKATKAKTSAYDSTATVRRIEGSTAWVHIPGGIDETPVELTISAKIGDVVQVRVGGGRAWIVGNASAPPTDDTAAFRADFKAVEAQDMANMAQGSADRAAIAAKQAQKIAGNTNQYFWHKETGLDTGAHITEAPQDDFLADPSNGGPNLLARSNGVAVRDGLTEKAIFGTDVQIGEGTANNVLITSSGVSVCDGSTEMAKFSATEAQIGESNSGNMLITPYGASVRDGSTPLAQFGVNKAIIGVSGQQSIAISNDDFTAYNSDGAPYFKVNYDCGTTTSVLQTGINDGATYQFASTSEITLLSVSKKLSASIPVNTILRGTGILIYFDVTSVSGATVSATTVSSNGLTATSLATDKIRVSSTATQSFTIGTSSTVFDTDITLQRSNGNIKFTYKCVYDAGTNKITVTLKGKPTTSTASMVTIDVSTMFRFTATTTAPSYTLGNRTDGSTEGGYSAVIGDGLIAGYNRQTVVGKYNNNTSSSIFEVGNGTADNARSNAMEVTWSGIIHAGNVFNYGECSTEASTAAKFVTIANTNFNLNKGACVAVKFTNTNTASNPTLNVNNTGAVNIMRYGTTAVGTSAAASWNAGSIVPLMYDGTNWVIVNFLNTTYSSMTDAEISAGTGTSTRVITPARLKSAIWTWAPSAPSDRRLKEHVEYLDGDLIRNLTPVHYIRDGQDEYGFYAQDVAKYDDVLVGEDNGYMTLNYRGLIAPLVAYVQHLEKRIEELEKEK